MVKRQLVEILSVFYPDNETQADKTGDSIRSSDPSVSSDNTSESICGSAVVECEAAQWSPPTRQCFTQISHWLGLTGTDNNTIISPGLQCVESPGYDQSNPTDSSQYPGPGPGLAGQRTKLI